MRQFSSRRSACKLRVAADRGQFAPPRRGTDVCF